MTAAMSILGLYNYDNTIFDNFLLPAGVDADDVKNNLLLELAELEILYSEPETMKAAIGFWSKKELPVWQKLYDTTVLSYNPIDNFDRTEESEDIETRNLQKTRDASTINTGESVNTGTDTTTNYKTGYNSATEVLNEKDTAQLGTRNDSAGSGTIDEDETDTGTVTTSRTAHMHGNIGVTTTQQMIAQERDISKFNIVDYIIDSFKMRFCILVY